MIKLSQAIRTGASPDPLDAAMDALNLGRGDMLHEPYCRLRIRELHHAFPHIGASVRQWPALATRLERIDLLPRIRTFQATYRQEIHRSIWQAIVDLCGRNTPNYAIADLLEEHGL